MFILYVCCIKLFILLQYIDMYWSISIIFLSPASIESPIGGAVGKADSPQASAEIEGEESEVVCIDTPTQPQCDLVSLLHEVTPLPIQIESNTEEKYFFTEIFISVDEEASNIDVPQHVRELLLEYQHTNPDSSPTFVPESNDSKNAGTDTEKYEKSIPLHGDEMFHNFVSRIQNNPGQLLRYKNFSYLVKIIYFFLFFFFVQIKNIYVYILHPYFIDTAEIILHPYYYIL